jgi:hypothetical protein
MDGMPMAPMRDHAPRRGRRRFAIAAASALLVVGSTACNAFSDPDEQESTVDVERESREEGDVEGQIGDELEVYDLVANVTEVERVASFSDLDNRGYIVATVSMENPTSDSIDFNRADWQLEKPDGTLSNTANVSNEPQLQDDTIPAGGTIEGTVIYSVGDLEGQFAIVFSAGELTPEDPLEAERGVWVFESSPGDAS